MSTEPVPDNPTADIVWAVTERVLALISDLPAVKQPKPNRVEVSAGFPGDGRKAQHIWLSEIAGNELETPVMTGARVPANESYRIVLEVEVLNVHGLVETHRRLAELFGQIDSALREAPNLSGFPGVRSCLVTEKRRTVALTVEGHQGVGQIVITVNLRIQ